MDLLGFGLILPLLPYIAENFHATPLQIGLLTATYSFFQFIAGPILGRLSDRHGRKKLLVISQLGSALGFVILGTANSLPLLFLSRLIDGITGGNLSIAQAYIADITDSNNRAKGMGLLGAAFGLGFMLGPAIGGYLSSFGFIVPALFAASIAALTSAATTIFLKETIHPPSIFRSRQPSFSFQSLRQTLNKQPLGLLLFSMFLLSLAFSNLQGTYALFVELKFDWGPKEVGYIFALIGIIAIITQLKLVPFAVTRFGERFTFVHSIPLIGSGFAILAYAETIPLVIVANTLIPLGNSLANPTLSALASENVRPEEYGTTLGFLQSAGSLGRILGPIMGGFLFSIAPHAPYLSSFFIFLFVYFLLLTQLPHPSSLLSRLVNMLR